MQHTGTVELETPRLLLRPFRLSDDRAMYANWASDPEVARYLTWRAHSALGVTQGVLDSWCNHAGPRSYNWAITLRGEDAPIGSIGVVKIDEAAASGDIGYALSRRYWRQGIVTEAGRAVFRHLFETVGFDTLTAAHDVQNPASGGVMQKLGMRPVGECSDQFFDNMGRPCTVRQYALSRAEFETPALRPACREEVAEVAALYDAVGAPGAAGPRFAGWRRGVYPTGADAAASFVQNELYVASLMGRTAGTVVLNREQPEPYAFVPWAIPAREALVIHRLAVHPAFAGRGLGRALLAFAEEIARAQGLSVIRLDTYVQNRPAQRLYEACGYRRAGEVDLGYGEAYGLWSFCVYEKKLKSGDGKGLQWI